MVLPYTVIDREPWLQTSRVRQAIRDAINRRYDLIHYIYSTVERTTYTAEPLMRAMWNEFPDEKRFLNVASQFMFGDSILVAPKVTRPQGVYKHMHKQLVKYALPQGQLWFNYYTKAKEVSTPEGQWVETALSDLEQAVFVRAGSILPILLHDDCESLIPCMRNDIRLEVYPDSIYGAASGSLYLDDGASYEFTDRDNKSARLNINFANFALFVGVEHGNNYQDIPNVQSVVIYGVSEVPKSITTGDGSELAFVQDLAKESIHVIMPDNTKAKDVYVKFNL